MSRFHRNMLILGLAVLLALPFVAPTPASAGTERYTTISTLPYSITTPGGYKLTTNIATSMSTGNLITIACDNVTVDLDGFTISSTTNSGSPVYGIVSNGFSNITIRNGKLRRCSSGIDLRAGSAFVVEDVTVMDSFVRGIWIRDASGPIVRRCSVTNTGTSYGGFGILVSGVNAVIQDNVITKTLGGSVNNPSICIDLTACERAVVERNVIVNDYPSYGYVSFGIKSDGDHIVVVGNRIAQVGTGVSFWPIQSGGYYRDNFADGCGTAKYVGGTDAGNNY